MKKTIRNNRFIAFAFTAILLVASAPSVMAGEKKPSVPVEMTYAGQIKNQPVFQLTFSGNADQNEFTVIVNDEFGNSLYRENFKGEIFSKKFLLNTDEIGENTLHFEIYCTKTKQSVTYEVNRNSRFVQDVAITKVR